MSEAQQQERFIRRGPDGSLQFNHAAAEHFRSEVRRNPEVRNLLLEATQDQKWANAILSGPTREQIEGLRANPEKVGPTFEQVYGLGAAEHYINQRTLREHLADVPKQALGGIQEGAGQVMLFGRDMLSRTGLPERFAQAPERDFDRDAYREQVVQERAIMTNDQIDRRFGQIVEEIEALRTRDPSVTRRWTHDQMEARLEQLQIEASVLNQDLDDSDERYTNRREEARRLGATVMAIGYQLPMGTTQLLAPEQTERIAEAIQQELPETITGEIVGGMAQFAAGFALPGALAARLAYAAGTGVVGQFVGALIAGAITDATAFDPEDPMLIDFIEDVFDADFSDTWVSYIQKDDDDSDLEKRLKQAVEGAGIGTAVSGVLMLAARGIKGIRRGTKTAEEVAEEVESALSGITVEENGRVSSQEELNRVGEAVDRVVGGQQQAPGGNPQGAPQAAPETPQRLTVEEEIQRAITSGNRNDLDRAMARLGARKKPLPKAAVDRIVKSVRKKMDDWLAEPIEELRNLARGTIRDERPTTMFGEARTDEQLVERSAPHARVIMDRIRAGDVDGAMDYMLEPSTLGTITDKAFAYQSVARTLEKVVDRAKEDLLEVVTRPGAPPEIVTAATKVFDRLFEGYLKMETVHTNLGSWWGSLGRQRQSAYQSRSISEDELRTILGRQAQEKKKGGRKATRTAGQEEMRLRRMMDEEEIKRKRENHFWALYQSLRKGGASALDAHDLIQDYIRAGRREGVPADSRLKVIKEGPDTRSLGQKTVDAFVRYQYGSMLSGPDTHFINNVSSLMRTIQLLGSEGAHAAFKGPQERAAFYGRLAGMQMGMRENLKHTWEALKRGRPLLSDNVDGGDANRSNFFAWGALRAMAGSDQFFSGNWYRGEIASKAAREAHIMGLKGSAQKDYIKKVLREAFDPDGRGIDLLAVHQARMTTFQQPFSKKSKYWGDRAMASIMDTINHPNPMIKALANAHVPFARIFFTLMGQGIRLNPLIHVPVQVLKRVTGHGNMKFYDDLVGNNGQFNQARATGEMALGTAFLGWAASLAVEGRITGGSSNHWLLDPLTNEAVPPYHVKIGDRWVNYGRYEPFAFTFKFVANLHEANQRFADGRERGDYETFMDEATAAMGIAAFVMGQFIASNPFMQTGQNIVDITNAFTSGDAMDSAMSRYLQGQVDKMIPNFSRKLNESLEDGYKFTGNDMWSRLQRNFTWLDENKWSLDMRRNPVTGEPIRVKTPGTSLAPINDSDLNDPVAEMILEAHDATGMRFDLRTPTGWSELPRGIDLRDHKADDGRRSLYDFFLETVSTVQVDGKTYRQALHELATNPQFRDAPWGNRHFVDTDKVNILRDLRSQYQDRAVAILREQKAFQRLARENIRWEHQFQIR